MMRERLHDMIRFTAHCAKGHDRVDFTDPGEFERHLKTVHKARKIGGRGAAAVKPYPWTAPKAPADTLGLTAVLVKADAGGYDIPGGRGFRSVIVRDYGLEWSTPDRVTVDELEAGTVFECMGRVYELHGIDHELGSIDVSMRPTTGKPARPGMDRKRIALSHLVKLAAKGDHTVSILERFEPEEAVPAA